VDPQLILAFLAFTLTGFCLLSFILLELIRIRKLLQARGRGPEAGGHSGPGAAADRPRG
jgi:hypothetical protein